MYYYLNGELAFCDLQTAVVDCGGVGYQCNITANTYQPGNLERCLEKNKMFAEINNIRYGVFRYNTCLARASIFSKCNNLLSKDPITEMFK